MHLLLELFVLFCIYMVTYTLSGLYFRPRTEQEIDNPYKSVREKVLAAHYNGYWQGILGYGAGMMIAGFLFAWLGWW